MDTNAHPVPDTGVALGAGAGDITRYSQTKSLESRIQGILIIVSRSDYCRERKICKMF